MKIAGRLVLPPDVEIVRATELAAEQLDGVEHADDDWVLTRLGSRVPSSVVSNDLATLLELFRGGSRLVDAVVVHAQRTGGDPEQVLEAAFPAVSRFVKTRWLVAEDSPLVEALTPSYAAGDRVAGLEIVRCVRRMEDGEVYLARSATGRRLALKVADGVVSPQAEAALDAEASALRLLDGAPSPVLVDRTTDGGRHVLAMEWCDGVLVTAAADEYRNAPNAIARRRLATLLARVLDAYASLHERGVLHGDVHPGNVLVDAHGTVSVIDFGLAQPIGGHPATTARGGVPEYFDPELADALRNRRRPPPPTPLAEQYALAALCYRLATGRAYARLPSERQAFLDAVVEAPPRSFADQDAPTWPELEAVLSRALEKDPQRRFESVAAFASAVRALDASSGEPSAGRASAEPAGIGEFVASVEAGIAPGGAVYADGVALGPRATVTYGAAGIAYHLLRAAVMEESPSLLTAADQWAEHAARLADGDRGVVDDETGSVEAVVGAVSPYHARSGIALVRALVAEARCDGTACAEAVETYLRETDRPGQGLDATTGAASVLLGQALLVAALRGLPPDAAPATKDALTRRGNDLLRELWATLGGFGPAGDGSGPGYSGIAHGWAGILYATLVWCETAGVEVPAGVERRLAELGAFAEPDGRGVVWPARLEPSRSTAGGGVMASWCNGAPGQVHLWNAAARVLGDRAYGDLAVKAAWNAAESFGGGVSVCCGQAGRVFALLSMYRHSGDAAWLARAKAGAVRAVHAAAAAPPQLRASLYKGDLGVALAIRELEHPEHALHPLFEPAGESATRR